MKYSTNYTRTIGVTFCLLALLVPTYGQTSKHGNLTPDFLGELMSLAAMSKNTFEKSLSNGYHKLDTWKNFNQAKEFDNRITEFTSTGISGKEVFVIGDNLVGARDVNTDFLTRLETKDVITLCRYSSKDYLPFSMIQDLNEKGFRLDIRTTESKDHRLYPNSFWYKKGHYYIIVSFLPYLIKTNLGSGISTVISESCATYYKNKLVD